MLLLSLREECFSPDGESVESVTGVNRHMKSLPGFDPMQGKLLDVECPQQSATTITLTSWIFTIPAIYVRALGLMGKKQCHVVFQSLFFYQTIRRFNSHSKCTVRVLTRFTSLMFQKCEDICGRYCTQRSNNNPFHS